MFSLFKKVENNVTKLIELLSRKHPRNFLFTSKPFQRVFWQNFDLVPLRNIQQIVWSMLLFILEMFSNSLSYITIPQNKRK